MTLIVREATKDDLNAVFDLILGLAVFEKSLEKLKNSPEQMAKDWELFHALVAEVDKKIVGMTVFNYSYHTWSGKSIYLNDLYVLEEYRGRGIGTALLKKLFLIAREMECKRVRWQVLKWNTPALEFYKKIGAKVDEESRNCDFDEKAIAEFNAD